MIILGLTVFPYFASELLAGLALFSAAFFFLVLTVMSAIFIWSASKQMTIMTIPTSRNLLAFSRRLVTAYAKS